MNDRGDYQNPKIGETYFSPAMDSFGERDVTVRYATKLIDGNETYGFALVKDELVLRHTKGGGKKITAKFIEDPRGIYVVEVQCYNPATEKPHNASFAFVGDEIGELLDFMRNVWNYDFNSRARATISDEEFEHLDLTKTQITKLVEDNPETLAELARSNLTKADIVAVGFRKKQLDIFLRLLSDSDYFEDIKSRFPNNVTKEGVWQRFFETNRWIFGYGLSYLFLTGLDEKKLEQVVRGFDLTQSGKRVDALMKTRGVLSNLCFVEIKTHETPLLSQRQHRPSCWAPSRELVEAVNQIQVTVASATQTLSDKISTTNNDGTPTGEQTFNIVPKSFLVIGNLSEFIGEHGVNEEKYRCFEVFRRSITHPEIITYDELHERARFIVAQS